VLELAGDEVAGDRREVVRIVRIEEEVGAVARAEQRLVSVKAASAHTGERLGMKLARSPWVPAMASPRPAAGGRIGGGQRPLEASRSRADRRPPHVAAVHFDPQLQQGRHQLVRARVPASSVSSK